MQDGRVVPPAFAPQKITVEFPRWLVAELDREATRIGIARQVLIKTWIVEKIEPPRIMKLHAVHIKAEDGARLSALLVQVSANREIRFPLPSHDLRPAEIYAHLRSIAEQVKRALDSEQPPSERRLTPRAAYEAACLEHERTGSAESFRELRRLREDLANAIETLAV